MFEVHFDIPDHDQYDKNISVQHQITKPKQTGCSRACYDRVTSYTPRARGQGLSQEGVPKTWTWCSKLMFTSMLYETDSTVREQFLLLMLATSNWSSAKITLPKTHGKRYWSWIDDCDVQTTSSESSKKLLLLKLLKNSWFAHQHIR